MNSWSPLEHHVFRHLRDWQALPGQIYAVAVSGGPDSVALLHCLQSLKSSLQLDLQVLHVHHGVHENREFRDQSEVFTRDLAARLSLPFVSFKNSNTDLKSESSLRELRRECFKKWQAESAHHAGVFLGHHADDLLETRMLRLLRGVGAQGLESMSVFAKEEGLFLIRPFLQTSKAEILKELEQRSEKFQIDPSAEDLRSWLRKSWLPQLEAKLPGAVASLARSLQNLSEQLEKTENFIPSIQKNDYLALTGEAQRQWIAGCMRLHLRADYTRGQIQEVQKRLDKLKNEHIFELAGLKWVVDAKNITSRL